MTALPWDDLNANRLNTTLPTPSAGQRAFHAHVQALLPQYRLLKTANNGQSPSREAMRDLVQSLRQRVQTDPVIQNDPLLNYQLDQQRVSETYRLHHAAESERLGLVRKGARPFPVVTRSYQPVSRDTGVAYLGEDSKSSTTFWAAFELVDGGSFSAPPDRIDATYHEPVGLFAASNGVHRTLAHVLIGASHFMADTLKVCSAPWDAELEQACWELECWDTWGTQNSGNAGFRPIVSWKSLSTEPGMVVETARKFRQLVTHTEHLTASQRAQFFKALHRAIIPHKTHTDGLRRIDATIDRFMRHLNRRASKIDREKDRYALKSLEQSGVLPYTLADHLKRGIRMIARLAERNSGEKEL